VEVGPLAWRGALEDGRAPGSGRLRRGLAELRRRWWVYGLLAAVWGLAYARLFIDPTPHVPVLFNWTPSLPYRVAVMEYGGKGPSRGDYVVFAFEGPARADYPGLAGQPFFKIVRGIAGDRVTVLGRDVYVNGEFVGRAKSRAFDGRRLEPIAEGVIPQGFLYVQGTGVDSFDSRYAASGLVRGERIIGRVRPIL